MLKTISPSNGHSFDVDPAELADTFLTLAQNVHTRKRYPSRIGGRRTAYTSSTAAAIHLLSFNLAGFDWWLKVFTGGVVKAMETANEYVITPVSFGSNLNPVEISSCLLNGIPCLTNNVSAPWYWDGNSAHLLLALPNWPASTVCAAMAAFRFHLFALNIAAAAGASSNMVKWSDAAGVNTVPATWVPAAGNEAGSVILADTPGACITALGLSQQLAVYKQQSIFALEYVGQPNIFSQRTVVRSAGALGSHCVQEITAGGQLAHLVLGLDDVFIYDGTAATSIATDAIKIYLANSVDDTNGGNSYIVRLPQRRETWICVPEKGNQFANIAHIWDEARNTWVTRDLNQTRYSAVGIVTDVTASDIWDADAAAWDTDSAAWDEAAKRPRMLTSEAANYFVEDTSDAVVLTSRLQKLDMAFDDDTQIKMARRVWLRGTGDLASMQLRMGFRNSPDAAITWNNFVPVASPVGEGTAYEVVGRYISIEITHLGSLPWTIDRIVIDAVYVGPY